MEAEGLCVVVYKCDFCGEIRDCVVHRIETKDYDVCSTCWQELMSKLKGKGRTAEKQVQPHPLLPFVGPEAPEEPTGPFPGQPPEIIGHGHPAN
jgi:Zinc finger, ZZ type